jgi:hypothetical protein
MIRTEHGLSSVNSREKYLIHEHFTEVESLTGEQHAKAFSGQTFAAVVMPKELGSAHGRHIPWTVSPRSIGLIVEDRRSVGFECQSGPPFSTSGNLAVQSGSFLDFVNRLNNDEFPILSGFGEQRVQFVNQVAYLVGLLIDQALSLDQ